MDSGTTAPFDRAQVPTLLGLPFAFFYIVDSGVTSLTWVKTRVWWAADTALIHWPYP